MVRIFSFVLLITLFTGCKLFKHKSTSDGGGGSYLASVDSVSIKDIQIVYFTHSEGVIFPAEYGRKIFGNGELTKKCEFFTPDSILIKKIELEIDRQYCSAIKIYWQSIFSGSKADTSKRFISSKDTTNVAFEAINKFCTNWQANQIYYYRQYIGYITPTGDKIIIVQLIDFRNDPRKLRQVFTSAWIAGWHGWYYSNTSIVYFNVNKNKLRIGQPN